MNSIIYILNYNSIQFHIISFYGVDSLYEKDGSFFYFIPGWSKDFHPGMDLLQRIILLEKIKWTK